MDRRSEVAALLAGAALALSIVLLTACNGLPTGATYTAGKTPAKVVTPAPCKGGVCPIR